MSEIPSAESPASGSEQAPPTGSGQVLYRRYRPQSFAEVAGQEPITRTLRNSVASGRLAHAYLFCGPRGTGKTSLGRLLAKAANCDGPVEGEPCNQCQSCLAFLAGRAIDFVEQDAASHNSVDDIRQLRENVILTPMAGRRKVYLLDEVHMLSSAAENALLKTLEEPPPHIIFVLATTDPHKVAGTIISRCQRFDLRRIPAAAAVAVLAAICEREGFSLERAALEEIARGATGSLRDAINGLEQAVTYYGRSPTLQQVQEALGLSVDARSGQLARLALAGDLAGGLRLIATVRDEGVEMRDFCRQTVRYLRGLLLAKAGVTDSLDLPADMAAEVKAEAGRLDRGGIIRAIRTFGAADFRDDPSASGGSLPLELALVEVAAGVAGAEPAPAAEPGPPIRVPVQGRPPAGAEPQFSIPAAVTDDVASTATSTVLQPPAEAGPTPARRGEAAPPPPPPPPVPTPAPATIAPEQDLLERVRRAAKEKEADRQLAGLLNGSCEVKSAEGDTVVLGFYHTFHLERIENGPYALRLEQLFAGALGRPVKLVCEHSPRTGPPAAPARGGHLVQAARELGATPVGQSLETEGGQDG
ncbi:MAG: DNA polymerase III subunit gamma/tau [Dehalococcoidia bacterium]|nr:DNA polymerase III subunit gamma/tau [Dehalococcoidia bacterium]